MDFMMRNILAAAILVLVWVASAQAETWDHLVERLEADGRDPGQVLSLLLTAGPGPDPSPMADKIKSLYVSRYGSEQTAKIQKKLASLGYDPGPADGRLGRKTRSALALFQMVHGLNSNGRLTPETAKIVLKSDNRVPAGIKPPALPKSKGVYRSVLTKERLDEALDFYTEHTPLLASLEQQYGVPREVAVGVLAVETRMGQYLGEASAFMTLASMAACDDFKSIKDHFAEERVTKYRKNWIQRTIKRKSDWAYKELLALLDYSDHAGLHPLTLPGSIYGAIGISQFMPTNALIFGVDGNGDGVVNLFHTPDALHSMANFLRHHAGKGIKASRRHQRKALYRYNPSRTYVNTVMAVADHLHGESKAK
jgi:membrane-bound lytic murein transglycosylase B